MAEDFDMITLGDGTVAVNDELGFRFRVSGSRQVSREPQGWTQAKEDGLYRRAWQPTPQILPRNTKWCYRCGNIRDKGMFRSDCTRPDGLYPVCKECENAPRRERYAEQKAMRGKSVRPYRRRSTHLQGGESERNKLCSLS